MSLKEFNLMLLCFIQPMHLLDISQHVNIKYEHECDSMHIKEKSESEKNGNDNKKIEQLLQQQYKEREKKMVRRMVLT